MISQLLGRTSALLERSWSLLGRIWGGPGGGLGGLGAPFGGSGAVLERSWAVLERSWRPSCGNVIFERFLGRFWGHLGRPRGVKWSPSWTQNGPKSKTKKKMQREGLQDRLGEVLEPSWSDLRAILAALEAILGRFRGVRGVQNQCFSNGFQYC